MVSEVLHRASVGSRQTLRLSRGLMGQRGLLAVVYLAPMLLVLIVVAGWPLGRSLWFSLTDASLAGDVVTFVGLDNFLAYRGGYWSGVLADPRFWSAAWNTIRFAAISVAIEIVLAMVLALLLQASLRCKGLLRFAVLIPWAVPTVVAGQMWAWMLHDQFGIVNEVLLRLALIDNPLAWLADDRLAMWSVITADVWKTTPFLALLFFAALRMVPRDCLDAARLDGVHPVTLFFRVTLPLIRQPLLVAVLLRLLDALRVFDVIYVMLADNPATLSLSLYARQAMVDHQHLGQGSAASTVLFALVALIAALYIRLTGLRLTIGVPR